MIFHIRSLFSNKSAFTFLLQGILIFTLSALISCSKTEVKTDAPFDAEKSIAKANELVEKKDYDEARKTLIEVKNRDLTKKHAPLAQLKIADSYVKEEEYDLAVEEYKKFLDIYPSHKDASYAQYQIAMAYFVQIESPERGYGSAAKAIEEFEKLKRMFPRNPFREAVEIRLEKSRSTVADYEFSVAEFYFRKGSCNAALGRYQLLISKFPDYKQEPMVLYHISMCYKKLGDKDKTLAYLNKLMEKYPDDKLSKEAKKESAAISR